MGNPPFFLVLEGIDGSGTTTQLGHVARALQGRGHKVCSTREPTTGPVGAFLRQALERRLVDAQGQSTTLDWSAMALLFAADRLDHAAREILPALGRGEIVISDRYDLSSITYQSATAPGGEQTVEWLRAINQEAVRPDLTVVLDIDPEVAGRRRRARGGDAELYEADDLQRRLAALYRRAPELLPNDPIRFVEADLPVAEVTSRILACLDARS